MVLGRITLSPNCAALAYGSLVMPHPLQENVCSRPYYKDFACASSSWKSYNHAPQQVRFAGKPCKESAARSFAHTFQHTSVNH